MKVIVDDKLYRKIWKQIYRKYKFNPTTDKTVIPFKLKSKHVCYKLNSYWTPEQEKIVNEIFEKMSDKDIYALDWQSDGFEYNPKENIELFFNYYDEERNCQVYFPSYYPDGDYHMFISKDWSYGMLGHPWRDEIYIFGEQLIKEFANKESELNITKP